MAKTSDITKLKDSLHLITGTTEERLEASKNTKFTTTLGLIINVYDTGTVTFQGDTTNGKSQMEQIQKII